MPRSYSLYILISLLALAGIFLWLYSAKKPDIANYPSQGGDIIAFGDSLVYGQGADPGKDFVSLLSQRLGAPIINLGVPGDTTAEGLARIDQLDEFRPKVVLVLLGGNDYLRHVPQEETFKNLAQIIERIQSRGAIVFLLGVRGGVLSDHFADRYEELHQRYKTAYAPDVLEGLLGHSELMSDEVHPNNAGYAIIADKIYPQLEALLK